MLAPFVIGFVECAGRNAGGIHLQLPFAIPVVHLALGEGNGLDVAFSAGSAKPQQRVSTSARATFVIACGFRGAAAIAPTAGLTRANDFVPLEGSLWLSLHERLSDAACFERRVDIVECVLARHFASAPTPRSRALAAADSIIRDRWSGPVAALADAFGIEERTLRNRFRTELGWAPKKLLRVARFNRALRSLHPQPWTGSPATDPKLEFADQSHFHHEFVAHAGMSPQTFVTAKQLSGDVMLHNVMLSRPVPTELCRPRKRLQAD